MNYEIREQRRAALSVHTGETLQRMAAKTPAERLAWHAENRGRFFFEPDEREARVRLINALAPARKQEIVAAADRLLRHEVDILGSGLVSLGDRIDWQRDFKSGVRWRQDVVYPAWNWRKVDDLAGEEIFRGHFYSIEDASDLKVPWDLSSFFHLPVLGEAFLQTGDARYSTEAMDQLRDWHAREPLPPRRELDLRHGGGHTARQPGIHAAPAGAGRVYRRIRGALDSAPPQVHPRLSGSGPGRPPQQPLPEQRGGTRLRRGGDRGNRTRRAS